MIRKFIMLACIFISATLFMSGIYTLYAVDLRPGADNPQKLNLERPYEQPPTVPDPNREEKKAEVPGPVNILILGLDDEEARSDVMMLLNFNPADGELNILSIARDTMVSYKGEAYKINAMMAIGRERLAIDTVENITELPVHYYVTINFKGFREIIDTLGGVEFNVPFNMNYDDPAQNLHIHLKKGWQVLDGRKAEQFVRYRKGNMYWQGYEDGDIGRIKAQQEFVKALIEQKVRLKYLSKADDIFLILKKYMKTNIEIGDISYYLKYLNDFKYESINTFTLPGDSSYIGGVSYFVCDWEEARTIIDDNFAK